MRLFYGAGFVTVTNRRSSKEGSEELRRSRSFADDLNNDLAVSRFVVKFG
jgi:hypothetical protein